MSIVLGSTSVYRRQLLERLGLPFETDKPEVDETPLPNESPTDTAERLAQAKARAVAARHPRALIIGSDQVAYLSLPQSKTQFGKPGSVENAIKQLHQMSGQIVVFHTALCLLNSETGHMQLESVPTEVKFRSLSEAEIIRYVEKDQPLDCAGSAKSESLGISLLDYMRTDDPNALIGLPLIALCRMLRAEGVQVP